MTISLYQISIPVFVRELEILGKLLAKAAADTEARKIEPSVFINARLAPDMFPLSRQVQIATDVVKGGAARVAGVEIPSFADTESSFPELQARIAKTVEFLTTIKAGQVDGQEAKAIALKVGGNELQFTGQDYLLHFVLPNLFFHITATYAILRHNGVAVGKRDYLGG